MRAAQKRPTQFGPRSLRLLAAGVGVALLASAATASTAMADVGLVARSSPARVTGQPPWTGKYRLDITAGDLGAIAQVYVADGYAGVASVGLSLKLSGAAIDRGRQAGSATGPLVADPFSPGGYGPCLEHARASGGFTAVIVAVPPHSTGSVEASQVLAMPPWPGDSLGFRFRVDPVAAPPGYETVPSSRVIALGGPRLDVARGVRIRFTSPRPRYGSDTERPSASTTVGAGRRVAIRGSTRPSLRGQTLRLTEARSPAGRSGTIARVRVGRSGRFRYDRWMPAGGGPHFLNAAYRSRRPSLASTRTRCGPVVVVR